MRVGRENGTRVGCERGRMGARVGCERGLRMGSESGCEKGAGLRGARD